MVTNRSIGRMASAQEDTSQEKRNLSGEWGELTSEVQASVDWSCKKEEVFLEKLGMSDRNKVKVTFNSCFF